MSAITCKPDRATCKAIAWLADRAAGRPVPEMRFGGPDGPVMAPEALDRIAQGVLRDFAKKIRRRLRASQMQMKEIPK